MPNFLVPQAEVIALTPVHRIVREIVSLDVKDAHEIEPGKFMPSRPQLDALAVAAGITFSDSRPLPSDDTDYIRWQVEADMAKPDGTVLHIVKSYGLDMRWPSGSVAEHIRGRNWATALRVKEGKQKWYPGMPPRDAPDEEWAEWVETKTRNEHRTINRFRDQRAETGAHLRCIRSLLRMKSTYTEQEIRDEFIVIRASLDIQKALAYGGRYAQLAEAVMLGPVARALGLSPELTSRLLTSGEEKIPDDLKQLSDKGLSRFKTSLSERGYTGAKQDKLIAAVWGERIETLDERQARITEEILDIDYVKRCSDRDVSEERVIEIREEILSVASLAYSENVSVVSLLSEQTKTDIGLEAMDETERNIEPEATDVTSDIVSS